MDCQHSLDFGLQDLAADIARQRRVQQDDSDRHLEGGQAGAGELQQLRLAAERARPEIYDRGGFFAEGTMWDSHNGGLDHCGVTVKYALNLNTVDVLAAPD